ncbi:DNase I-like protein [Cristinia sonorae]|uniref:DNase I-like protein n=1 Tax=Cristinia sonorae TaxID=1940300 RepID=A0A8K0XT67_9AGAR|nr:DNase I-like protein [Cristinia sonorae]
MRTFTAALVALLSIPLTSSVAVTDIQGPAWLSPLVGQTVNNVTGIVTGKSKSNGFFISGTPSKDRRVSHGLTVFTTSASILSQVNVGDLISLSGKVSEFRSSTSPDNLFATELQSPSNIVVLSSNNTVEPLILGKDRSPPTQALSGLDRGRDGWLSVPNNRSQVDVVNANLRPDRFGMDFWSSLEGQLVTVRKPVALEFENNFGEFWVHGDWPVTGKNKRGGLTITFGPNGIPDANPETVIIGSPLDGTKNPHVTMGMTFSDITGIVFQQFGFFYILPTTAPTVLSIPDPTVPPTTLRPTTKNACELTIGDYNVENFTPTSSSKATVANHIASFLASPDIMFLQEIQDNSGSKDDGTVIANVTLSNLSAAITLVDNSTSYEFVDLPGVNNQDGGQPGGNIRSAYLFRSSKVSLLPGSPVGGALDATLPIRGPDGKVSLSFNPGRIDPTNSAWNSSRKPLVVAWETTNGHRFFTINVHLTAKLDSSSTQGNSRPPVNAGVDQRTSQVETIAKFVKSLLKLDPLANVIIAGDHNEYIQTRSVFKAFDNLMFEIDEVSNVPVTERYTYVFDQNTEQLDHIWVSAAIAARGTKVEHIHVNNWAPTLAQRTSDHDPSVARVHVC